MPKLKTALITIIATLIFTDWIRLKVERELMEEDANKAVSIAEWRGRQVTTCLTTLNTCNEELGTQKQRIQFSTLIQAQTAFMVRAAQQGDKEAAAKLAELGWSWDDKRRVLQTVAANE